MTIPINSTKYNLKIRYLVIKLILDSGTFPTTPNNPTGSNVKIIRSDSTNNTLAAEATINKQSGFLLNTAEVKIYGMLNEDIQSFTRFQRTIADPILDNFIEIYAGYDLDETDMPDFVFKGQILYATPDFNDPNRPFIINAQEGFVNLTQQSNPLNLTGTVSFDNIFRSIIAQNSLLTYVPNGIIVGSMENPNFSGSVVDQLEQVCSDHGFQFRQDGNKILVSAIGQPYDQNTLTLDGSAGDLIGYPTFNNTGVDLTVWFNPAIQFGQYIILKSYLPLANSNWYINSLVHTLQTKGDYWKSQIKLNAYAIVGNNSNG